MTTLVLACRRGQGSDWWKHLWIAVSVVSRRRNLPTLRQERFLLPAESCASWYMAPVRLVKINTSWVFRKCCSPCCSAHVTLLTLYLHALYDACVSSTALTLCEWSPSSLSTTSALLRLRHTCPIDCINSLRPVVFLLPLIKAPILFSLVALARHTLS